MACWVVIKTKKHNKTQYTSVPSGWLVEEGDIVYWPKDGLVSRKKDRESLFESEWIPQVCKIMVNNISSSEEAEEIIDGFYKDSETSESDSMLNKAIKRKPKISKPKDFVLKSYLILPPTIAMTNNNSSVSVIKIVYFVNDAAKNKSRIWSFHSSELKSIFNMCESV